MSKETADGLNKLDVNWLVRERLIENHCGVSRGITWTHKPSGKQSSISIYTTLLEGESFVELSYKTTNQFEGTSDDIDYKVPLMSTPCYFGGCRYWFKCPMSSGGVYCGRRVAKLYYLNKYFACRHCHNLSYKRRNESKTFRDYPFKVFTDHRVAEELEEKMKRRIYAGQPTRKERRRRKLLSRDITVDLEEALCNYMYKK